MVFGMGLRMAGRSRWGRRRWKDLPSGTRRGLGLLASVQFALFASALVDLVRRPASQVRGGRKWAWLPVLFVNVVGPIAYLLLGRRGAPKASTDASLRL